MKKGFIIGMIGAAVVTAGVATATLLMPPPQSSPASAGSEMELTDNMSDTIRGVMDALGPAPDNVVGFGMGFKRPKGTAVTGEENSVLLTAFRNASKIFASEEGNMGCSPTVDAEKMLEYDPQSSDNKASGYGAGNSMFIAKAGYTKYDRLGNVDSDLGKTVTHFVSIDKTVKQASSKEAQAVINTAEVYAYWLQSLPEDNKLKGTVYNKGADDRKDEPVKEGTLYFKRIGPNPSSTDEKIEVKSDGRYEAFGKLTAGHYEVSFDPKDGKGKKVINPNWLYIPGEWKDKDKDWYVLVRATYSIVYDHVAKTAGSNETVNTLHMEWHHIPIDWLVESEEALRLGTEACFDGTYCLTYDYVNADEKNRPVSQENIDESETEITPGYYPDVFKETPLKASDATIKLPYVPTLSFYRGAEEGGFIQGNFYMCLQMEITVFIPNGEKFGTALVPGVFDPMTEEHEAHFRGQGWEDWAFLGKLDTEKVKALAETRTPLEIYYKHPNGAYVKVIISAE